MPAKPTNELLLTAAREDWGHTPGHLAVTTVIYAGFAYLALTYAPDAGASKYLLYGLVMLPLAAPAAAMFLGYAAVICRRFAARLLVRRARRTFRSVLRAARIHPELADLDKLRAAAASLAQLAPADARRASVEIALTAEHRYAPIRNAARSVIEATRERKREARSGPSGL